ncbi:hypothetical protein C8Q76DRAFT_692550 [Earliella scabrosa]|nr:hypothetical protein C8Q76DRAFT_692550 [Earliella scabrosa]
MHISWRPMIGRQYEALIQRLRCSNEHLQADVVREDRLSCARTRAEPYMLADMTLEQLLEVLVALLVLVARLPPLCDCLSVEDEDVEGGVEQEDDSGLIEILSSKTGCGASTSKVYERGLDHDERGGNVVLIQHMPVKGRSLIKMKSGRGSNLRPYW